MSSELLVCCSVLDLHIFRLLLSLDIQIILYGIAFKPPSFFVISSTLCCFLGRFVVFWLLSQGLGLTLEHTFPVTTSASAWRAMEQEGRDKGNTVGVCSTLLEPDFSGQRGILLGSSPASLLLDFYQTGCLNRKKWIKPIDFSCSLNFINPITTKSLGFSLIFLPHSWYVSVCLCLPPPLNAL